MYPKRKRSSFLFSCICGHFSPRPKYTERLSQENSRTLTRRSRSSRAEEHSRSHTRTRTHEHSRTRTRSHARSEPSRTRTRTKAAADTHEHSRTRTHIKAAASTHVEYSTKCRQSSLLTTLLEEYECETSETERSVSSLPEDPYEEEQSRSCVIAGGVTRPGTPSVLRSLKTHYTDAYRQIEDDTRREQQQQQLLLQVDEADVELSVSSLPGDCEDDNM